jgi:hypothetical protein
MAAAAEGGDGGWEMAAPTAILATGASSQQLRRPRLASLAQPIQGDPMTRLASSIAATVLLATLNASPAGAADLKVISAGAVRGLIAQIIDDYSQKTGQKFDFTIGTTGQLRNIIASGQAADLLIVSTPLMAELEKTG